MKNKPALTVDTGQQQQKKQRTDDVSAGDHDDDTIQQNTSRQDDDDNDDVESGLSTPRTPDEDINFDFVYALYRFEATLEGQITVKRDDPLYLLDDSNSYWWLVRPVGHSEVGYIPAENIETPFERLARLNRHRNVKVSILFRCMTILCRIYCQIEMILIESHNQKERKEILCLAKICIRLHRLKSNQSTIQTTFLRKKKVKTIFRIMSKILHDVLKL